MRSPHGPACGLWLGSQWERQRVQLKRSEPLTVRQASPRDNYRGDRKERVQYKAQVLELEHLEDGVIKTELTMRKIG